MEKVISENVSQGVCYLARAVRLYRGTKTTGARVRIIFRQYSSTYTSSVSSSARAFAGWAHLVFSLGVLRSHGRPHTEGWSTPGLRGSRQRASMSSGWKHDRHTDEF